MTLQNEQTAKQGRKRRGEHCEPTAEREHRLERAGRKWAGWEGWGTGASVASQRSLDILGGNKKPCEVLSKVKMVIKGQ